jgi:putative transposase
VSADVVATTLLQFRETALAQDFQLLAYCFMPDHVHLLVEGRSERANLCHFAKLAKQRSGSTHSRRAGCSLWQEGYHDRVLRDGEDIRLLARYMLNNPVRAGLVKDPTGYPYLGSDRWTISELVDGQW